MRLHVETLFPLDASGRIVSVKPDGSAAPRFFLGRTKEGNVWWFRQDLEGELLEALDLKVSEHTARSKEWPKAANALGGRLKRIAPDLRKLGVDITFASSRTQGRRITITRTRKDRPDRPDRRETGQEDSFEDSRDS